jgi:hypothetical protein
VTASTHEGLPTQPVDALVVLLEPPGPQRERQLAELARTCTGHSTVTIQRRPARPWLDAFSQAAGAFHGPVWAEPLDDDQGAFMQCASALAATGASWSWRSAS